MDILPPVPKTKKPFRLGRCETLSGGRSGIQSVLTPLHSNGQSLIAPRFGITS